METPKPLTDSPSIVAVLHELVKKAPSGLRASAIASLLGRDYQTLMSELSRQPAHKLGADVVLPLMKLTGSHLPLDVMAAELGLVCVCLPAAWTADHPVHRQCMVAVEEFGKLMGATAAALDDGTIVPAERDAIATKGYEALTAIVTLLRVVEDTSRRA